MTKKVTKISEGRLEKVATTFAKMGVRVVYTENKCAYDSRAQVMYLPYYAEDLGDADLRKRMDGYCDHETGHAVADHMEKQAGRKTWSERSKGWTAQLAGIVNAVEDCRIEARAGSRYAGIARNLRHNNDISLGKDGMKRQAKRPVFQQIGVGIIAQFWGYDTTALGSEVNAILDRLPIEKVKGLRSLDDSEQLGREILDLLNQIKEEQEQAEAHDQGGEATQDDSDQDDTEDTEDNDQDAASGDADDDEDGEDADDSDGGQGADTDEQDGDEDDTEGQGGSDETTDGEDGENTEGEDTEGETPEDEQDGDEDTQGSGISGDDDSQDTEDGDQDDGDQDEDAQEAGENGSKAQTGGEDSDQDGAAEGENEASGTEEGEEGSDSLDPLEGSDEGFNGLNEELQQEIEEAAETATKGRYFPHPNAVEKDVIQRAKDTFTPQTIQAGVRRYQEMRNQLGGAVKALSKKLARVALAKTQARTISDQDSGQIDTRALAGMKTGRKRIFQTTIKGDKLDTAVAVMVDASGSMRWEDRFTHANAATLVLSESLQASMIPHAVYTYSTLHSKNSYATYRRNQASRYEPTVITTVKDYNESNRKARGALGAMYRLMRDCCGAVDGETLIEVAKGLENRPEQRKIVIVLSDGAPAAGPGSDVERMQDDAKERVAKLRAAGYEVYSIGIQTSDPKYIYGAEHTRVCYNPDDLPKAILDLLSSTRVKRVAA